VCVRGARRAHERDVYVPDDVEVKGGRTMEYAGIDGVMVERGSDIDQMSSLEKEERMKREGKERLSRDTPRIDYGRRRDGVQTTKQING